MMTTEYYVIVDLDNLTYMSNGINTKLDEADKFETLEKAKEELEEYDEDSNVAIYKVKEFKTIELKKVR